MGQGARPPFEQWVRDVNEIVLRRHGMSIYELDDDIPRSTLRTAYENGIAPAEFADVEVSLVFMEPDELA